MRKLRGDALRIYRAALLAADPCEAIRRSLRVVASSAADGSHTLSVEGSRRTYHLEAARASTTTAAPAPPSRSGCFDRVMIVGGGKASAQMAAELASLLSPRGIALSGHVVTKRGHADAATARSLAAAGVACSEASHPIPDAAGVEASRAMLELIARDGSPTTLVIACLSGGGSALLTAPALGLSLSDVQASTSALLRCGAPIEEMNTLRKHLSRTKGGQLAQRIEATGATLLTLVLSDVVGDDLTAIASGPTVPDRADSTFAACVELVERRALTLPDAVLEHLRRGCAGTVAETPKRLGRGADTDGGDGDGGAVVLCGTNAIAVSAAAVRAEALGYAALVLSTSVVGEAREVAKVVAAIAKELVRHGRPLDPRTRPVCVILGGETTVTLPDGHGLGGRNQELALAAALEIDGLGGVAEEGVVDGESAAYEVVILAAGTDGTDGPCDAAGAIVDARTAAQGRDAALDGNAYLRTSDSYHFFERLDAAVHGGGAEEEEEDRVHLKTGPTGTNVMDITIVLVAPVKGEEGISSPLTT